MLLSIVLALCVFTWGLLYKLSLYDPPNAKSFRVPIAKLLSKNEQSSTAKAALTAPRQPSPKQLRIAAIVDLIAMSIALLAWVMTSSCGKNQRTSARQLRLAYLVYLEAFFVRPPPILV